MPLNSLWEKLLKSDSLKRGWHLARDDSSSDFAEDLASVDLYAVDIKAELKELANRLATNTFKPKPLKRIEVPKGSLGFRPGSILSFPDRIVVSAIIYIIAEVIDKELPDSVFSWRLKKPIPRKGPLFKESSILDLPYLKKKTIRFKISPFEPWYANWPEFDKVSRTTFRSTSYRFLATSDIAAYFENIQLPLLRDQLLRHLPNDPKIVNLLFSFLEVWAHKTDDGRTYLRGIPQGNFVSSFLGNIYLLPLEPLAK